MLFKPCCLSSIVSVLFCTVLRCWKINVRMYICMYVWQIAKSEHPYVVASSKNFRGLIADELRVKLTPDYHSKVFVYEFTIELCCLQPIATGHC